MKGAISVLDYLIILGYFVAVIYIGKWASSKVKTAEDFHLGGRAMGKLETALSTAATDFGGSGLVGAAGLAYAIGLAGGWWDLAATPAWIILGLTLAAGFRRLALCTVPEFLEKRYGASTRIIAAVFHIAGTTFGITAQTIVAALAFTTLTGIPEKYTVLIASIVFVAYTAAGGLVAVVWTDVMQYFVLMAGVVIALPLAIVKAGGWGNITTTVPASFWDLGAMGWMEPLAWIAMCFFAYGTSQYFVQRLFAAKDEATAKFAYVFTGVNYIFYAFIVAILGIAAAVISPGLENSEMAIPVVIREALPIGLKGLFLAAILAATMSTSASMLTACSSMFTVDIWQRLIKKDGDDKHYLAVARWATVIIAIVSLVATYSIKGVVALIVLSNLIYSAGVFFPVVFGMYSRRVNVYGATSAIVIGGIIAVTSKFLWYGKIGGLFGALHPMFTGSLTALAVLFIVSYLTPKPAGDKVAFLDQMDVSVSELQQRF